MKTSVTAKQLRAIPADLLLLTDYHLADKPCGDRPETKELEIISKEYHSNMAVSSTDYMAWLE